MRRIRTLVVIAAVTAGCVGCGSATARQGTPRPPGWVAHPTGATSPAHWVCFGTSCYHVDSTGHPYGQPFTQQRN